jgi:hypothetical protein
MRGNVAVDDDATVDQHRRRKPAARAVWAPPRISLRALRRAAFRRKAPPVLMAPRAHCAGLRGYKAVRARLVARNSLARVARA